MSDRTKVQAIEHGVQQTYWDNLGNGWRFDCLCGYTTSPSLALHEAAEDLEDHWHMTGAFR